MIQHSRPHPVCPYLSIYFLKVALPGLILVVVLGYLFGWVVHFLSKKLELFTTEYQYQLILPSFIALGIILWAVKVTNGFYIIVKNRKSLESEIRPNDSKS